MLSGQDKIRELAGKKEEGRSQMPEIPTFEGLLTVLPEEEEETEEKTPAEDLDLRELWSEFVNNRPSYVSLGARFQNRFLEHLREITSDPEAIDDVRFCYDCGVPEWEDEMSVARGDSGMLICQPCAESWSDCDDCDRLYPDGDITQTLDDQGVCGSCLSRNYTWCEDCNGYYADENESEHDHGNASCCNSPQLEFTIRNNGSEPLANDTPVTITMPAGVISAEGLKEVRNYLCQQLHSSLAYDLEILGDQWQTKDGNFAKRLSRHAYKAHHLKLTPAIMSQVGVIARDHSNPVSVTVEVTRDLNQSASYFYHEDSCWWGSYSESRCTLKTNGGFALRTFSQGDVSGRAWVMPLRKNPRGDLVPTFDTMTPDAFVVFNGYGDLSGYIAPRIVAHMAGWTYRRIGFRCDPMYVNAGGYIVAPEPIAKDYTDGALYLNLSQHSSLFITEERPVSVS